VSIAAGETMTCREFVELVTDYLEGRLPDAERERFEGHVAICPGCQAYVAQMEATLRALGRIPEDSLSPEARDHLLHAFRDWKQSRPAR
jgi:anti-sigma factor RsiW